MKVGTQIKPPKVSLAALKKLEQTLEATTRRDIAKTARLWAKIKGQGGKVVVATGSGPNLHEGVTTLVAELVRLGLVDGVLTSSAVVGHEMAGGLERVRRVDGRRLKLPEELLPADGRLEVALLTPERLEELSRQTVVDVGHYRRLLGAPGREIVKVAGNLAYPTGLWLERAARWLEPLAKAAGVPLEAAAGLGCDGRTMLGACAQKGLPCLVTTPQLVGAGQVGLSVGDSISLTRRSHMVADLLASADLIIESGLALAQEIHDGPFELYTGHGLWAHHEGMPTFSLKDKAIVRIDLDPQLKKAWEMERKKKTVGKAIDRGRPKATSLNLAFRMEMSGFARLPGSLPVLGDLGVVWPVLAGKLLRLAGVKPEFICYKQGTPLGEAIRDFIVDEVKPFNPARAVEEFKTAS